MIADDFTTEEIQKQRIRHNHRFSTSDPKLKFRLRHLLRRDLNSVDICEEIGIPKQNLLYFIRRMGLSQEWEENKARRRKSRPSQRKVNRMRWRISQKVLDEFEKRGYSVTRGRIADECRIEGVEFAVFQPRKPFLIKSTGYNVRYFVIRSKYLNRFVVVLLPNGKWFFWFPKKKHQKQLSIPEWQLQTEEEWPTKLQFRHFKSQLNLEKTAAKGKRSRRELTEEDILHFLGVGSEEGT